MVTSHDRITRRNAVSRMAIAAGLATTGLTNSNVASEIKSFSKDSTILPEKVEIGLVADVHQDIIHDGFARINAFITDMNTRRPNAILQLGDFALPRKRNQPFLDTWNSFDGGKYHVLGNHDMRDIGFKREQTMEWWGMEKRFYSFDIKGWHFVILDGNDQNPGKWSGYVRYIGEEQRDWLEADLKATQFPTIVFSHQQLESDRGVANSGEVRQILESTNEEAGFAKVVACFCGHHHTDKHTEINGIHYTHINSMSYKWVGTKRQRIRFPKHIEETYPNVKKTIPYQDPLYTVLTLDPKAMTIELEGKNTVFVPPTPLQMELENATDMQAKISTRSLPI